MARFKCLIAGQAGKTLVLHGQPIAVGDDSTCDVQDERQLAWLRAQPRFWIDLQPRQVDAEPKLEREPHTQATGKHGRKGKRR